MRNPLYAFLGFCCIVLGIIGIPTPGLPTTPFLLLAAYFFGKSSPRLHAWFLSTKLYDKYLKEYDQNRAMTMKQKLSILGVSAPFCLFALFVLPNIWGKLCLVLVMVLQYYYFFFRIKTLPANTE